jgi:hypothetical protein
MAVSRLSQQSLQQAFPKGNTFWDGVTNTSAFDSLGTVIVPSAGLSSVTFSNIPSTYTHLQMRGIAKDARGAGNNNSPLLTTFNGDSGANYSVREIAGNGSVFTSFGSGSTSNFSVTSGPASDITFGAFIFDILDYSNTSKYKTGRALGGTEYNGSGAIIMTSGSWRNTNAVTSITFTALSSPFAQYSQFSLYGIK